MSRFIRLNQLPCQADPASIYWELRSLDLYIVQKVTEIYGFPADLRSEAWIEFETHSDALDAISNFDGMSFGSQHCVPFDLVDESDIDPVATERLSDFLRERDNQMDSSIIKITKLPIHNTAQHLEKLFQYEMKRPSPIDPEFRVADYQKQTTGRFIMGPAYFPPDEPGTAILRWSNIASARQVILEYSGQYFKENTIYLYTVPDPELDTTGTYRAPKVAANPPPPDSNINVNFYLNPNPDTDPASKDVMIFVYGVKPGSSIQDVQEIFAPVQLKGVIIPPPGDKTYCFIYVRKSESTGVMWRFARGVEHKGRMIYVRADGKMRQKEEKVVNVKIKDLHADASEADIRELFAGFDLVTVRVLNGHAFVALKAKQADEAVEKLDGKSVRGQEVIVKMARQRGE